MTSVASFLLDAPVAHALELTAWMAFMALGLVAIHGDTGATFADALESRERLVSENPGIARARRRKTTWGITFIALAFCFFALSVARQIPPFGEGSASAPPPHAR